MIEKGVFCSEVVIDCAFIEDKGAASEGDCHRDGSRTCTWCH